MSDLPPLIHSLEKFKQEIGKLKRGKEGEHLRPHKLVMLLSVLELMDRGLLRENKIYLSTSLITIFENIFVLVKRRNDLCQPGPPFFHLRSSGFWFHKVRPERKNDYVKLTTTGGGLKLIEEYNILNTLIYERMYLTKYRISNIVKRYVYLFHAY